MHTARRSPVYPSIHFWITVLLMGVVTALLISMLSLYNSYKAQTSILYQSKTSQFQSVMPVIGGPEPTLSSPLPAIGGPEPTISVKTQLTPTFGY